MGRPKGSKSTETPRTIQKQVRWTVDEWNTIETAAKTRGLSVADLQRQAVAAFLRR